MSGSVAFVEEIEVPNLLKKQPSENVQHLQEGDNSFVLTDESNPEASVSSKCEDGQVLFPNRDVYSGMLADCIPAGFGKYVWSDGCMYEGEWDRGMITGQGKFSWPSGATYEGEFSGGFMHGSGTYVSPNTLTYKGDWRFNVKHGSGRKNFANGDVYEGSWIDGVIEGPGKYVWANGSVYTGNMKGGKMSGKGFFTWSSGDSFEGNWMGGVMHGFGVYTWADGGCYVGTWSRGLKDGKGTFYPYGGKLPGVQQLYQNTLRKGGILPSHGRQDSSRIRHASSVDLGSLKLPRPRKAASGPAPNHKSILLTTDQIHPKNVSLERRWSLEGALEKVLGLDGVSGGDALSEENDEVDSNIPVLEREYMQGVLISELVISTSVNSRSAKRKQKKLAKEYKRPGEAIIKGHRSYDLMLNLQLGIRYTVGKITPIQRREVRASDFGPRACFWMSFPKEGSQLTPPHKSVDFKWKDYCPMVFRNLREMFKIDAADYMISICGSAALRELSSPGKSGSVFFLSQDDRFMIKTLRKSELHVLLRMLPNYHHHVRTYENTLITKFFGLHRIKTAGGQKFRFVVMGNMFCTELRIHRRYDLKGSSQGRSTNKIEIDETTTLKDLDLNYQFYLEASWRESLLKQIQTDCQFLKIQQIMDYSLLLGVHYRAPQYLQSFLSDKRQTQRRLGMLSEEGPDDEIYGFPQSLILVPLGSQGSDVVVGPHIRGSRLRAAGDEEVDLLLPGTARLQIQLGVNMPARAERITREEKGDFYHEAYDVVIYLGIIDILQEYNVKKKFEHACKSLQYDSSSISAVDPDHYAQRFLKFIQFVFPTIS